MAEKPRRKGNAVTTPLFEPLEQRLLLTTIHGGDFFIYLNSQGDAVRIDLQGEHSDSVIEVFTYDEDWGGVHDLVGFYNGDPGHRVRWDDGVTTEDIIEQDDDGNWSWITYTAPSEGTPEVRGAQNEIYAIFVAKCTTDTVLTISTLTSADIPEGDDLTAWANDINTWSSAKLPILQVVETTEVKSPTGSGGVIVGARRSPTGDNPIRYIAAADTTPETVPAPEGVFPGGDLAPGITVLGSQEERITTPVGRNVHSVASDSTGNVYMVDPSAFQGTVINMATNGVIGQNVASLAGDSSGTFYAVDNSSTATPGDPYGSSIGTDVRAIAVDDTGVFYAVNEATHHLISWDSTNGYSDIGELLDTSESTFRYDNITALDYDSTTATLFGVGTITDTNPAKPPDAPDPNGPFLITIDVTTGQITGRALLWAGVTPLNGTIDTLAFDSSGTCYAVNGATNDLVTINTSTGEVTVVGTLNDAGSPVTGMVGIDFIGQTLYGVTNDTLYQIDPATAACTNLGSVGLTADMGSLAYDPTRVGSLFTAVDTGDGYLFTRIPLAHSLIGINTDGEATAIGRLLDSSDDTWVWKDIYAMDFDDGSGLLYAIATAEDLDPLGGAAAPAGRRLVTIDPATGLVTDIGALTGATDLQTLAFNAAGNLYGVDTTTDTLYQINPSTGAGTAIVGLGVSGIVGIEFVQIGGNEVLYGVTGSELYALDMATGAGHLLGDTGQSTLSSLAFDNSQSGVLWSTANPLGNGYRLTKIELSSMLVRSDGVETVTQQGLLFDASEPAYAYTDIHALEFNDTDVLYGVGTIVNIDPVNVAGPADAGPYLITINTSTGAVTQVTPGTVLDVSDLSALAHDSDTGDWYGVHPDAGGDELLLVDMSNSTTSMVGALRDKFTIEPITGVTGLDFESGVLYAITGDTYYSVITVNGFCTWLKTDTTYTNKTGLSGDTANPGWLWFTTMMGDGEYYLVHVGSSLVSESQDLGRIIIGGTVAGQITNPGSINVIEMGFLWGNVEIGGNVDALITRAGGGAVPTGTEYVSPEESRITVGGTLNGLYTRSGTLYSAIEVENDPSIASPESSLTEYEVRVAAEGEDAHWVLGDLVDFNNDSMSTAQFLNHPSGEFDLSGQLVSLEGVSDTEDWYAIPLLADQTIVIDGSVFSCVLEFYDSAGNLLDTFGYETTLADELDPTMISLKPLTFTSPSAGIYYLRLFDNDSAISPGGAYSLDFTGATGASLGAVSIGGNYYGMFNGTGPAEDANIATKRGGTLGAVSINGGSYDTTVHAIAGGDLVVFQAGVIGPVMGTSYMTNSIISDSNIGGVFSTDGHISANIIAGSGGGFYNPNAYIQNIHAATDFAPGNAISATGSIGVIEIEGDLQDSIHISVNSNNTNYGPGMGSRLDMLDIGGDYHAYSLTGEPFLTHGPGGDIGFIHVGGTIYAAPGVPLDEITFSDGRATILNDDGGGRMTITPITTAILDDDGNPVLDEDGNPTYFTPTYSFAYIPVEDSVGGVGGVIANLRIDGTATFTTSGVVQLSDLDLSGAGEDSVFTFGGSGTTNIYYVHSDGPINTFTISTDGNLVSGNFGGSVNKIDIAGNIGPLASTTGAWIHGNDVAPASGDITSEPQYGWFHGTVNGLQVSGELGELSVDGSLHDLRVTGGKIGKVIVNADNNTPAGAWDGVSGIVWSDTRIDSINVGDGLADDGGATVAKAAIMSTGSIGKVSIKGPRHTIDNRIYGELQGSIIGMANTTEDILDEEGNVIGTVEHDAVELVSGTNGATLTAQVLAEQLDSFQCFKATFVNTGGIGTVSFSGPAAEIYNTRIAGFYVRKVSVTGSTSYGIYNTSISGTTPPANKPTIELVEADGPGMNYVDVRADGGDIGTVKGLGTASDITNSTFIASNGMKYLGARDLTIIGVHMPGTVTTINASRDLSESTIKVGSITRTKVGGDFEDNHVEVASNINSMTIKGSFIDSYLSLNGPSVAYLKSLVVTGDISGEIISAGKIGSIITKTGGISADISTIVSDWNGDINLIQTAGGYTGALNVAGSLKKFISNAPLGDNPATTPDNTTQIFNIQNDLKYLKVKGDLYAGINVGGDIGKMDIDGTFYSSTFVNGNMDSLVVDGGLGGVLGALGTRGNLTVLGNLKSLKFNTSCDLFADLTVGGTIKKISLRNGSIIGNLTSRYGSINSISLKGGSIIGDVQASSIGKITVSNGNLTGNITATNGNIKSISVKNGDLSADVTAENGSIDKLSISNGDATAGHTILASNGIGTVSIKGDLGADLISGKGIKKLSITGSDVTGMVNAAWDIKSFTTKGNVIGTTIRSGGQIKSFKAAGLNNAIISSAWNLGSLNITGDVTDSYILAGFDVGDDGAIGTPDDNPLTGSVHSGDIKSLTIRGALDSSIVAAGIDGGAGGYLNLADNTEAPGQSSIKKMTVKGGFGATPSASAVLADTSIYQKFADQAAAAGVTVNSGVTTVLNGTGTDFGPGTAQGKTLTDGNLTLTLNKGRANYDPATGNLVLEETSSRSSLKLTYKGAGAYPTNINITSSDDSGLSSLQVKGNVTLGNMNVDGNLKSIKLGDVANGSAWVLPGGVKSAKLAGLTNVNVTAGEVGSWKMSGAYNSGTFTVDSIKSFYTKGSMGANFISTLGGARSVNIRGGNFDGDLTVQGDVRTLSVAADLAGNVAVTAGDLSTIKAGSISGTVNVIDGAVKSVTISTGDFGGGAHTSFRSAAGIKSFKVSRGNFTGLLSTRGDLNKLSVKGEMTGRAWSGRNIKSITLGSMDGALVASSGDINTVNIKGDMFGSHILAGFDPGDAGYDNPAGSGEDANLMIDAFTNPAFRIAQNTDRSYGGTIKRVTIEGDMGRHTTFNPITRRYEYDYSGSTIAAGIAPGEDGYWGTDDDTAAGIGYVQLVRVSGGIFGSGGADESYGVFAANEMPTVYYQKNRPFLANGNAHVGTMHASAGPLTVTNVSLLYNSIVIYFNHPVNPTTIGTIITGMDPESLTLIVSDDDNFDPMIDTVVSATVPHTLTYDSANYSITFQLSAGQTWDTLDAGDYFQLTLDGSMVADNRGVLLDGEYTESFPSGNGEPGGDFVYEFARQTVLENVPGYDWWFGCAPTAAGMLVGYYDNTLYGDLITGDANDQTDNPQINETIASSGDGQYLGDGTVIDLGTPGTGHIPDYALYDGYNDYGQAFPYPDMSELDPAGAHPDDCLADFMHTSMSDYGLTMGGTWSDDIGPGIEDFFAYKGYTATSEHMVYGIFTWNTLVSEIDAGRPVILGVDAGGTGAANHAIIAIGYDMTTHRYACHRTWEVDDPTTPVDEALYWYDFTGVAPGQDYGIGVAVTVEVS